MTVRAVDTAIVGGGVIGCALAAELALRGQRVTVIERDEPGQEASGASAGMLSPQSMSSEPRFFFDLALESRNLYPEWALRIREETGLDVGYRRTGLLRCGFRDPADDPVLAGYGWQRESGLPVEERRHDSLFAEIDGRLSPEVRGALFFPEEAVVQPRRLMRALWLLAERRGARVLIGNPARRFRIARGICSGVDTDAGPIEAGAVVDAAGAWAAFDPEMPVPIPVGPVRGQMIALRVPDKPLPTIVCSEDVYIVPRPDGTILVGSTLEFVGFRKEVTAEAVERLIAAAVRLVPTLKSARFLAAWSGLRPGTPDGLPVLGDSPVRGLFFATGHFRDGILLAPVTARILADQLTGEARRDLSAFSVGRFAGSLQAP